MKLTTLGCWGGYPYKDAGTTSFLLTAESGFNLLIDAGSRAVTELEHELSPLKLDAVIISHYHADHTADLGVLQQYRQLWPKTDPEWDGRILDIYGHDRDPENFKRLTLEGVSKGHAYDVNGTQTIGPFDITFLETVHPVPCYAMRIFERETGQTLVFTGDSGWMDELMDFAHHADLLLADTYFFGGANDHKYHLTSYEAGKIARIADVKLLVLTHLPQHAPARLQLDEDVYLEALRKEAQSEAGIIPVELAAPHRKWDLNELQ